MRVQESEVLFEMMDAKVTAFQEAGFAVLVVSDFKSHIELDADQSPSKNGRKLLDLVGECNLELDAEQSPSRNGRKLLDLVGECNLRVGNHLSRGAGGEVDVGDE